MEFVDITPCPKFADTTPQDQFAHVRSELKEAEEELLLFLKLEENPAAVRLRLGLELTDLQFSAATMLATLGFTPVEIQQLRSAVLRGQIARGYR